MTEEKSVVIYQARDGQNVKLTPSIIKKFLVSGRSEYVTEQELYIYMGLCKSRGLNPFIKDCYLIKYSPRDNAAIITSIDYYRKRARAQPDCQGWQTGVIVMDSGGELNYRQGCIVLDNETLIGGWFEALPRGHTVPMRKEVPLKRYIKRTKEGNITKFWQPENQPEQIAKIAESQGLRATWPDEFQGLYVDAEMQSMEAQAKLDEATVPQETDKTAEKLNILTEDAEPKATIPPEKFKKEMTPDEMRQDPIYRGFDPSEAPMQKRYDERKILKLRDLLDNWGGPYLPKSASGRELHSAYLIKAKERAIGQSVQQERGEEPPPPDPPGYVPDVKPGAPKETEPIDVSRYAGRTKTEMLTAILDHFGAEEINKAQAAAGLPVGTNHVATMAESAIKMILFHLEAQ